MGPERYGRVRGYGIGVTPTQLSMVSRFTRDARDGAGDVSVRRLEAELTALRQTRDSDRAEIAALRATHDADRAEMQIIRTQLEHLTSVMHIFIPSQINDYITIYIFYICNNLEYIIIYIITQFFYISLVGSRYIQ